MPDYRRSLDLHYRASHHTLAPGNFSAPAYGCWLRMTMKGFRCAASRGSRPIPLFGQQSL
jgi:hypothetical protein